MSDPLLKLIASLGPEKRGTLADLLRPPAEPIAIVGMGCRFPSASSPDALWRLLCDGVDGIRRVPASRWDVAASLARDPSLEPTAWGGFLDDVDQFEPGVFGISRREALHIDPQQRIVLEVVWEALENAGLPLDRLAGTSAGVFLGACSTEYGDLCARDPRALGPHTGPGICNNMLSGRVSYVFDLRGPSLVVDTACSSSLVAVHLAIESLRRRESTVAIAGGVNLVLAPDGMRIAHSMQLLAADGRCKVFDAQADGIARGEGCGIVVLKRLSDAVADGDRVLAVIRGTAVNQDGRSNGITAPNGAAQRDVIERALAVAGVAPADVGYVEAHGTGTALGDPIEVDALVDVLGRGRGPDARCVFGSLKANLGHTEGAAGIASVIKAALALSHGALPPQIHFRRLNPHLKLAGTPFVVSNVRSAWPATRRIAGVSAFGWSGTNAHAVLEAAAPPPASERVSGPVILPLSAPSAAGLRALAGRWSQFLQAEGASLDPGDLVYTAGVRRSQLEHRQAVVGETTDELARALAELATSTDEPPTLRGADRVVFVFPGQGSQWRGMSRTLLGEPAFRTALEACDLALRPFTGWSVLEVLRSDAGWSEVDTIQPLIFAMQVSLAALWRAWGIEPAAVVGHSLGEIAAAHVAGALDLDDAARVIALRSQLVRNTTGRGRMALAELTPNEARELVAPFGSRLALAAINGPRTVLLSGETGAVETAVERLQLRDVFCRFVDVDYASHCDQMTPLGGALLERLAPIRPRPATVPICSTVSAGFVDGTTLDAAYWVRNLREPVLFHPAVEQLVRDGHDVFLELSPHPVLVPSLESTFVNLGRRGVALPSTRRDQDERRSMFGSLAALYTLGRRVDFGRSLPTGSGRRVVDLPTTVWQRERFWPTPARSRRGSGLTRGLLGDEPLVLHSGERVWDTELSVAVYPHLADHRVGGAVVFPGAGYVEMALEAARAVGRIGLGAVRFEQMLVLPEGAVPVQLVLRGDQLAIAALTAERFTTHSTAVLLSTVPERQRPSLVAIRERCPDPLAPDDFHEGARLAGIELGPAFRRLEEITVGTGEALARIRTDDLRGDVETTLLDAAFQVLGCALSTTASGSFLPIAIEAVTVTGRPGDAVWGHARLSDRGADGPRGDIVLFTDAGDPIAEVRGLQLRRLGQVSETADGWMYTVDWEAKSLPPAPARERGTWILVGDHPLTRALRAALEDGGDRCEVIATAADVDTPRERMDLDRPEEVSRVLREAVVRARPRCHGVVFAPAPTAAWETIEHGSGCVGALHTVQALVSDKQPNPPRLWLVTRGAVPIGPVDPVQAALWGLGRTIPQEHPELRCSCVDLGAEPEPGEVAALADELRADLDENQVAIRGNDRHVARLARRVPAPSAPTPADGRPFRMSGTGFSVLRRQPPGPAEVEIAVDVGSADCVAGTVVATGSEVTSVRVGERVVAFVDAPVATHVLAAAAATVALGDDAPERAVIALPAAALAHHAIVGLARVSDTDRVLIVDPDSPVGQAAVAWARRSGAEVAVGDTAGTFDVVVSPPDTRGATLAPFGRQIRLGASSEAVSVAPNTSHLVADLRSLASSAPQRLQATLAAVAGRLSDTGPFEVATCRVGERSASVWTFDDPSVPVTDDPAVILSPDGTYLVTGGLGGLGLEVAQWLVGRGARHLALVGRSDPPTAVRDRIASLGARVFVGRCDVADRDDLARLLDVLAAEMPPLRGVVHAAGVLDDGVLTHLDASRLGATMRPKALGAWNLHTLTRSLPLDLFVLFSSVAGVLGSAGQANYAAANAFLDGLAHSRRDEGLPAISIDWGAWRDVGLAAAQENRGERLARRGLLGLSPAEGLAALERVLGTAPAQVTVIRLRLQDWRDAPLAAFPIFARLLRELGDQTASDGRIRGELTTIAPVERRYRLETYVRKQIADMLRMSPGALDVASPLSALGFDSLMALEFRNRLDLGLGLRLSATALWAHRSIEELVPYLAEQMGLSLEDAPAAVADDDPEALSAADRLADDEVEAALLAKLDLLDLGADDV